MKQAISKVKAYVPVLLACALMGLMVMLSAGSASALPTTDAYNLDTTPYTGVVGATGTFVNSMISSYGVPAILISVAVGGWMFVRHLAKSALH